MQELFDLGIEHGGYRLSYFQAFNWGTFDNHIVTLKTNGKNSLLTGTNGSGKTTLVDALLTLLVPSNYRSYNLSSGLEGKKGRTEESYVLGTYSTAKNEEDYSSSRKTLRDKSCHSILLADFSNNTASSSLTIMQIRYFTTNGTMKKQFFIIEGDFSIEMMNDKSVGYNTSSNWIVDLKKAFPNLKISTYDAFKRYSYEMGKLFGFRSLDKALRIFAQTVGMKDLSNLNDFIRTKMLDEDDSLNEQYLSLLKNYNNLMDLKNIIEKEEKQIEILKNIENSGRQYEINTLSKQSKGYLKDHVLKVWEAETSRAYISASIEEFTKQKDEYEIRLDNLKTEKEAYNSQADQIKETLIADDRIRTINNLRRNRADKKSIIDQKSPKREIYIKKAEIAGFVFPENEVEFKENKTLAIDKIENIEIKIENLDNQSVEYRQDIADKRREKDNLQKQLDAIENRESNIPLEYLEIRDIMCSDIELISEDVKYIGELIQVKENCLELSTSIESLLNPLALTLLILPQNLQKVSTWLLEHQLSKRIEIIVIEKINAPTIVKGEDKDQLSLLTDDDEIIFEDEAIPVYLDMMLEIKDNFEYQYFLERLINKQYHLKIQENKTVLFDSINTFSELGMAHTKRFLVKGITDDDIDFRVLGWDTGKKKARLKDNLKTLKAIISDLEYEEGKIRSKKREYENMIDALRIIRDSLSFSDIDTSAEEAEIKAIDIQLMELSESTSDLESLKIELENLIGKIAEADKLIGNAYGKIGIADANISRNKEQKKIFDEISKSEDLISYIEPISKMVVDYNIPKKFSGVEEINLTKRRLDNIISTELLKIQNTLDSSKNALSKWMGQFIRPGIEYNKKYPTWGSDTTDLVADPDSLNVYIERLEILENDSLPKYKEQFSSLQTRQMKNDIISLNTSLKRWDKKINANIKELNISLDALLYQKNPDTKLRLTLEPIKDSDIKQFNKLLRDALPDTGAALLGKKGEDAANVRFMEAVESLIEKLKNGDSFTNKVLDVRQWHNYAVEEYNVESGLQERFYADSAGISGGQKAKLAYTILAAAIAHQFDVFDSENKSKAFRFVIVDEAFSKSDDSNSKYAMNLFKEMDLQLMVVTPMDKVNLVEPFIESIQVTICEDSKHSFVHNIKKDENDDFISGNTK
ncbi:MAG: hypothetical protein JJE21_05770 [Spirochaetaceae bacterium]|nr:hypothetical protein [Spirochaetaceae bacterium]